MLGIIWSLNRAEPWNTHKWDLYKVHIHHSSVQILKNSLRPKLNTHVLISQTIQHSFEENVYYLLPRYWPLQPGDAAALLEHLAHAGHLLLREPEAGDRRVGGGRGGRGGARQQPALGPRPRPAPRTRQARETGKTRKTLADPRERWK